MKTTQLLVAFGLLLQFSWPVVVVVGEGTDAAGSPAPKDTNLSDGDLKEIIEENVLDGKNGLFQYLIVGDASEVESCGHSQEELVPQEVNLEVDALEFTEQDKLLLFTVELSLSTCAREKVSHILLAANLTALVHIENYKLRIIHKLCFQHSVPVDGMIGKRVRFDVLLPQSPKLADIILGSYKVTTATVDKEGALHRAPPAIKHASFIN